MGMSFCKWNQGRTLEALPNLTYVRATSIDYNRKLELKYLAEPLAQMVHLTQTDGFVYLPHSAMIQNIRRSTTLFQLCTGQYDYEFGKCNSIQAYYSPTGQVQERLLAQLQAPASVRILVTHHLTTVSQTHPSADERRVYASCLPSFAIAR